MHTVSIFMPKLHGWDRLHNSISVKDSPRRTAANFKETFQEIIFASSEISRSENNLKPGEDFLSNKTKRG